MQVPAGMLERLKAGMLGPENTCRVAGEQDLSCSLCNIRGNKLSSIEGCQLSSLLAYSLSSVLAS